MRKTLTDLWRGIYDAVVPPVCWLCRGSSDQDGPLCTLCTDRLTRDDVPVCPRCASTMATLAAAANVCPRCLTENFSFDGVVRLGPYDERHREVILRMKHAGGEVLGEALSPLFAKHLAPRLQTFSLDLVAAVPLHWRRRWQRGYNQAEVLARAIGRETRLPVRRLLRRVRNTPYQTTHSPAERRANVRGAFALLGTIDLTGKIVLLVDDVLTTGATANEAARVLKKAGAKAVFVAVLAHESPKEGSIIHSDSRAN